MQKGVWCLSLQACVFLLACAQANAWDPLGHGLAAATGAKLIHDTPLRKLLLEHEPLLRASSAFPDIPFRKMSTAIAGYEAEAPNHFFHLDDKKVIETKDKLYKAGCTDALKIMGHEATRAGVSPWRLDQFERLAKKELEAGALVDAVYHIGLGSHMMGDQAIPWHAMDDAHGSASGHSNIHIFLEGCTDSFLKEGGERFDPAFTTGLEELARKRRSQLLVFLERSASSPISLSIAELTDSIAKRGDFEKLDTEDNFESGNSPPAGTPWNSAAAARKGQACLKFKDLLKDRLAMASAYVSAYLDHFQGVYKGSPAIPVASPDEVKAYEARPYPFFECPKP